MAAPRTSRIPARESVSAGAAAAGPPNPVDEEAYHSGHITKESPRHDKPPATSRSHGCHLAGRKPTMLRNVPAMRCAPSTGKMPASSRGHVATIPIALYHGVMRIAASNTDADRLTAASSMT
jgi:hypothetical protein